MYYEVKETNTSVLLLSGKYFVGSLVSNLHVSGPVGRIAQLCQITK